jgi:hypothetical protein
MPEPTRPEDQTAPLRPVDAPPAGGYPPGPPPPRKPGLFRQATSTTGGTISLIVAACLAGLLLLGLTGLGSLAVVRAIGHQHRADQVDQLRGRADGAVPPGLQKKLERTPQQPGHPRQPGNGNRANGQGNGLGRLLGGAMSLGDIQHGELTMQDRATGKATVMTVQRGSVTAASQGSLSVKSADGFTAKYVIEANTRGKTGNLQVGDSVLVVAEKAGARALVVRAGKG